MSRIERKFRQSAELTREKLLVSGSVHAGVEQRARVGLLVGVEVVEAGKLEPEDRVVHADDGIAEYRETHARDEPVVPLADHLAEVVVDLLVAEAQHLHRDQQQRQHG